MTQRPRQQDEREDRPAEEAKQAEPAPQASGHAAAVLQLQRTVGNAATARYLARNGPTPAPAAGVTVPSGPPPLTEEERVKKLHADYAACLANKNWAGAAKLLNAFNDDDIDKKLDALSTDDMRLMDDGAQRSMPGFDSRVRDKIAAKLKAKGGLTDARAKTGGQYGEIRISVGTVKDGVKGSKRGNYPVDIYFKPDTAVVQAEEIAFIQRVRLVDTDTGENKDWDAANIARQTDRKSSIDRLTGKKQGWYGMDDDASNGGNLKKWTKADAATVKEAWMYDDPGAKLENTTWEFETAAVSRKGPDAGTVYAVITWGFKYDKDMKVTGLPNKIFNKQSADFTKAVEKWNEQAKGPKEKSNVAAGGQVELPSLK